MRCRDDARNLLLIPCCQSSSVSFLMTSGFTRPSFHGQRPAFSENLRICSPLRLSCLSFHCSTSGLAGPFLSCACICMIFDFFSSQRDSKSLRWFCVRFLQRVGQTTEGKGGRYQRVRAS